MKTQSEIAELDLLSILKEVFGAEFPQGRQPDEAVQVDEIERGKITSPVALRLFNAADILGEAINTLDEQHAAAHEAAAECAHSKTDCEAYGLRRVMLKKRMEALRKLFWTVIAEEHPAVTATECTIRSGMVIASEFGDDWGENLQADPPDSIIRTLSGRLSAILAGTIVTSDDVADVAVAEKETVLGTVEDGRVRSIFALRRLLKDERKARVPAELNGSPEEVDAWLASHTGAEAQTMGNLIGRYDVACETLDKLKWVAIRDCIKDGHGVGQVAIRKDWQVVSMPNDEEVGAGVKVRDLGGVIVMDIPLGQGIALPTGLPPEITAALGQILSRAGRRQ